MKAHIPFLAAVALTVTVSLAVSQSIRPAPGGGGGGGGSGTVTSVGSGVCLTGGPITVSGTLAVACGPTDELAWNGDVGLSRHSANFLYVGNGTQNDSSGTLGAGAFTLSSGAAGQWNSAAFALPALGLQGWTAGANATLALDTGLSRDSAGVVDVGNGSQGDSSGSIKLANLTISSVTASSDVCASAAKLLVTCTSTGTGLNVQQTSPALITPTLGVATATSINGEVVPTASSTLMDLGSSQTVTASKGFSGIVSLLGGLNQLVSVITAAGAITVNSSQQIIEVDKTTGAATTVNIPAPTTANRVLYIVDGKGDANTNNITVTPSSGTINGAASYIMNVNREAIQIVSDGTQWVVL
jgi:hypothetical protein